MSSQPLLSTSPKATITTVCRTLAVDVLNPRLARFSNGRGRALIMACSVLALVVSAMAGMMYFQRELSFRVQRSMMSISSASATMGEGSTGMCETNTTRSTVLRELVRSASAPRMNQCRLAAYNGWVSKTPTGNFDLTLSPLDKYASIWAPILATQPTVTRVLHGHYCGHFFATSFAYNNGDNASTATLEGCFEFASSMSALAFSVGDGSECALYRNCSHPIVGDGGMDTYFIDATPDLQCEKDHGGISAYRPVFDTMRAYGELLGLAPPARRDGIYTRRVEDGCDIIGFSPEFVAFTTKLYHRLTQNGDDYDMPCVLSSCDDYMCFDQKPTICDSTDNVHCDSGVGIVSTKIMVKRSWRESFIAALALSHNMEIAASALVVGIFLSVCLNREERQELHMDFAEMGSIIQNNKTTASEQSMQLLKNEEERLKARFDILEADANKVPECS